MTIYTPYTISQAVTALGNYTPLTYSMLLSIVQDYTTDDINGWQVLDGIKAVIYNLCASISDTQVVFGDEFEARVWEALSFTKEDGGSVFDSDYDR